MTQPPSANSLSGKRKAGAGTKARQPRGGQPKRGTTAVDLRIYKDVLNAVMNQRLPPGTRLAEAEFCELYRVSRTTVRKALQRLAHDHIIDLRPNRGAVVAAPSPEEARQIFAARRSIEREIVPQVIANITPASLDRLRNAIEAEHQAMHSGDRSNWIRLGGEFHILLAEVAGNQVLLRFITELVSRCSLLIALYENPGTPMCEDDEHKRLVSLIGKGKTKEATALMEQHLLEIEARLRLGEMEKKISLAEALSDF